MPAYQRTHDAATAAFWTHLNDRCMQVYAQDAETTLPDRLEAGFRAGLKAAVCAAWNDAYAEGYTQGQHDARMDAMNPQDL